MFIFRPVLLMTFAITYAVIIFSLFLMFGRWLFEVANLAYPLPGLPSNGTLWHAISVLFFVAVISLVVGLLLPVKNQSATLPE